MEDHVLMYEKISELKK